MSRAIANEMSKLESKQIQSVEAGLEARVTDNGDHDGKGSAGQFGSRRRQRQNKLEDDEPSPSHAPMVGNLLNIKV